MMRILQETEHGAEQHQQEEEEEEVEENQIDDDSIDEAPPPPAAADDDESPHVASVSAEVVVRRPRHMRRKGRYNPNFLAAGETAPSATTATTAAVKAAAADEEMQEQSEQELAEEEEEEEGVEVGLTPEEKFERAASSAHGKGRRAPEHLDNTDRKRRRCVVTRAVAREIAGVSPPRRCGDAAAEEATGTTDRASAATIVVTAVTEVTAVAVAATGRVQLPEAVTAGRDLVTAEYALQGGKLRAARAERVVAQIKVARAEVAQRIAEKQVAVLEANLVDIQLDNFEV
jgi:hypothetical protein